MMKRTSAWAILIFTAVILAGLFFWPVLRVLRGGFLTEGGFTLKYLVGVFRNPIYAEGLLNSLKLGVGTTTLGLLIAMPLAWLAHRFDFPGKTLWTALVLVPMVLPPFVGAIGFQQILGQYGALNALFGLGAVDWLGRGRYWGVIILQALALYPILFLNITAALANVDPAMEEAAENLGCAGWKKFRRITLPLIMPGLFAGGILVFIWSFTELGTPLIMNYSRCAPVQIYDALKEIGSNPFPYALVFVLLASSVTLYGISRRVFGRHAHAMTGKGMAAFVARRLTGWRSVAAMLPFFAVSALAILPHVGVILTSFAVPGSWYRTLLPAKWTAAHYLEALSYDMTISAIRNSLVFSTLAVALNLALGMAIAFVVVRSDIRGRGLLDALSMTPLAVPGLVMAFGYLSISSMLSNLEWVRESKFWQAVFDVRINPTLFLVVAYAVRRLPYVVRAAVAGLQQTSVALEESAANLGARPLTTVRRITLPLIMANLIAGGLLAFAFSMLEVSDSLMLAQRADFYPITKTIYELFQLIGTGRYVASALGVWAMLFLGVTILGSSLLLGKKLGTLFRA